MTLHKGFLSGHGDNRSCRLVMGIIVLAGYLQFLKAIVRKRKKP